jgi:hypothetical protein
MSKGEGLRNLLWELLGEIPPVESKPSGILQKTIVHDGFRQEEWILDLNGEQKVPATLLVPNGTDELSPTPAIIYNHAHGSRYDIGRKEVLEGRPALLQPHWGGILCDMGVIVLCIDMWAFGGRANETESSLFKRMLWAGQVLWGRMVFDNVRALDWLLSRPEVDAQRIGTMGISLGSTMAWWHAALDERIKLCIDICCLTDFDSLVANGNLDGHSIYYYVPKLRLHTTTAEINALIAPRMHLSCAGLHDILTPPEGLDIIDSHLKKTYAEYGADDSWHLYREEVGHLETEGMRKICVEWLAKL